MKPIISIIVPYYGPPEGIRQTFALAEHYPPEVELIVVDDGCDVELSWSAPLSARVLRFPGPKVPWNLPACVNMAARVADGEWLFLSAADHLLHPNMIPALLGGVLMLSRPPGNQYGVFRRLSWRGEELPGTGILLVRAATFRAIGGYDEQYCGAYGYGGNDLLRRLPADPVTIPGVVLRLWPWGEEQTLDRDLTTNRAKFDQGPRTLPALC
jgi:glycosyltransferase involved in cell wall biosynthesis